jgi:hypothetical protein
LVSILRELNFPERYIQSKIDIDFRKYARTLIVEKQVKIIFKHENMLEKILRDVQKENYINIWLIRRDIDLTLYKLINFAINKKLIPAKQITAYRLLVKEFVIGENIPKDILFNVLPFLLRINNYNEKIKLCLESKSSN